MPENVWLQLLEAVGITIVFTQGSIFKEFRDSGPALWQELLNCPLCIGVWLGAALRVALDAPPQAFSAAVATLGFGAATGMLALLTKRIFDYLESSALRSDFEIEHAKASATLAANALRELMGMMQDRRTSHPERDN